MTGRKILVIIIALALLLACIIVLRLRRDKPVGPSVSEISRLIGGPAFEVQVEMPAFNSGRAPWEIPGVILGYDHGPRFDQASPGAPRRNPLKITRAISLVFAKSRSILALS